MYYGVRAPDGATGATMLIPLPTQPPDVPWPTEPWPQGDPPAGVDLGALQAVFDETFATPQPATTERTDALLVATRGRILKEHYRDGLEASGQRPSWSMAKSILHAAVGVLARDGRIDVTEPAGVPEWPAGDPRAAITLDSLLHMTPGLRFREDYVDGDVSDVIKMLFRPGAEDMAAFAASYPMDHAPDTVFNYSSGTTNIISAAVGRRVGGGDAYLAFLRRELFDRIGMTSAEPRLDASGTWIASSYCYCTPRDFARFGLLHLRDGVWDGERLLPPGWVDYARTPGPAQPEEDDGRGYGAHWWLLNDDLGTFFAAGYVGQYIMVSPALDLIIVRNGETPVERRPHVVSSFRRIMDAFRGRDDEKRRTGSRGEG
jgi:CubicO group peptidase (beta-lactamase class C family)